MAEVKRNNVKLNKGILDNVSGTIGAINITKTGIIRLKRKKKIKTK